MAHDWILEVLTDLRSYAQANDLPALAHKAEETLQVARAELSGPQTRQDRVPLPGAKPN